MATIGILRTRNGIPESADDAFLTIRAADGLAVYGEAQVIPTTPGSYSVTVNLAPGAYTAYWRFLISGFPDDLINRLFYLDQPVVVTDGHTLMAIERNVARRLGPYIRLTAETTNLAEETSTIDRAYTGRLKSTLHLRTYEDQYILRRGVNLQNLRIPQYDADDRVRIVAQYDTGHGLLYNDRVWKYVPDSANAELIEILYLDPDLEMRPSVLDGLRRCFFWDQYVVSTTEPGYTQHINLSQAVPWIISPSQVKEVGYSYPSTRYRPTRLPWWRVTRSGKTLTLWTQGTTAGNLSITALRPVHTLVNEELSLVGPNDDLDLVYVPMDYAVWACIVELWKNIPERLQPLIKEGLRTDLKAAAAEFTKKSLLIANEQVDCIQIDFGPGDIVRDQIGNLPELAV